MTRSSQAKASQDKAEATSIEHRYICRFDVLEAAFRDSDFGTLKSLLDTAGITRAIWEKLRNGTPVELDVFRRLSKSINKAVCSLIVLPEPPLQTGDPRHDFMARLEQLIDEGVIPPEYNCHPVDVVNYVWQLEDSRLDHIRLSYFEQRQAFRQLVQAGRLYESRLPVKQGIRCAIGEMEVRQLPPEQVFAALDKRLSNCQEVVDELRKQYDNGDDEYYRHILITYPVRHQDYLDAVELDDFLLSKGGGKNNVEQVMQADMMCRMAFLPRKDQEDEFESIYYHSRRLVRNYMSKNLEEFLFWWRRFRDKNTKNLRGMKVAMIDQDPPDFDALLAEVRENIENTRKGINALQHGIDMEKKDREKERENQRASGMNPRYRKS